MLGWLSDASVLASRSKRAWRSSSAAKLSGNTLSATSRPSLGSSAATPRPSRRRRGAQRSCTGPVEIRGEAHRCPMIDNRAGERRIPYSQVPGRGRRPRPRSPCHSSISSPTKHHHLTVGKGVTRTRWNRHAAIAVPRGTSREVKRAKTGHGSRRVVCDGCGRRRGDSGPSTAGADPEVHRQFSTRATRPARRPLTPPTP